MNLTEYRKNRACLPREELARHQGQWVAFTLDGRKIIASHKDLATLDSLVVAAGEDPEKIALERIEQDETCLGGAELQ